MNWIAGMDWICTVLILVSTFIFAKDNNGIPTMFVVTFHAYIIARLLGAL